MQTVPPQGRIGDRWDLGPMLGRGGQGSVHSAWDHRRGRRIAAKLVPFRHEDVRDLKREFRLLSGIRHPNVVRALDLYVGEWLALAAMEFVEGVTLDRHLAALRDRFGDSNESAPFVRAIRACFAGVMRALVELHARGIAHRDIKPGNILVRPDGQVVLVDLGLAIHHTRGHEQRVSGMSGTIAYMPPEQFWGLSGGPSVDLFAAGAVFAEAFLGQLPWDPGPNRFSSEFKVPDLSPLLAIDREAGALIIALLNADPACRPSALDAVAALSASPSTVVAPVHVFIGRTAELDALVASQRAAMAGARAMLVVGDAGMGKTTLIEEALVRQGPALVMRHRCHPRETLPYQALDGIVEDIVRQIVRSDRQTSLSKDEWASLIRVFPNVAEPLAMDKPVAAGRDHAGPDVLEDAGRVIAAALASIARETQVVLWIDDWHWGDRDSARIIAAALAHAQPETWWVFTARPSRQVEELGRIALANVPHDRLTLGPLTGESCAEWLAAVRPDLDDARRAAWIEASGGWPIHVHELLRSAESRLPESATQLVEVRVNAAKPLSREVLQLIGIATSPLGPDVLAEALGTSVQDGIDELVDARILTWVAADDGPFRLAPCHDLVREAIAGAMDASMTRRGHELLLRALAPTASSGVLLQHALGAERKDDALRYARESLRVALRTFAYDHAMSLLDTMAAIEPSVVATSEFLRDKAVALSGLGRGAEAGTTFLDASGAEPDLDMRGRLKRLAIEQLMGAGDYGTGVNVLDTLLAANDVPRPKKGTMGLLTVLWLERRTRAEQAKNRRPVPLDARISERLELLWVAGAGIGLYDSIAAFQLQYRHAFLAAQTSSDPHSALSLSTQALNRLWAGGDAGRLDGERLLAQAEWHARRADDPRALAHVMMIRVSALFLARRFAAAFEAAEEGERYCLTKCPEDGWHLASFRWYQAHLMAALGPLDRLRDFVEARCAIAEERMDRFLLINFRVGRPILGWLAAGQAERASTMLDWAERESSASPYFQYQATLGRTWQMLYEARAEDALAMVRQRKARLKLLMGFEAVRIEMLECEALAGLAAARGKLGKHVTAVQKIIKSLTREKVAWVAPHVDRLAAAVAHLEGATARRDQLLQQAALGFDANGQHLDAALARYASGEDVGAAARLGVAKPRELAAIWHPWLATDREAQS